MALLSRNAARDRTAREEARSVFREDAKDTLRRVARAAADARFDVFLCHAYLDAEEVKGVYLMLRDQGLSVYVDWLVDRDLDRDAITPETADRLRLRIRNSKALIYATSTNAADSKWMPWELGYADARLGLVAVAPLNETAATSDHFQGREYLGLYPYISNPAGVLSVHRSAFSYTPLSRFLTGERP